MKSAQKTNSKRESRISRRKERRELRGRESLTNYEERFEYSHKKEVTPLRPLTSAQTRYLNAFESNTITFGIGPAGTGKTYVAASYAADLLKNGEIERIIITRPGVEAGESFGFLPGELEEKYAPYIEPFKDVLVERLGASFYEWAIKNKRIIASPLSFMRGKTFKDCVVILDEAQNTSPIQMKLFLTRIGQNCKMIIDGDSSQKDISGISGLDDAISRLRVIPSVGIVRFEVEDIVRHGIIKNILRAYER